MSCSPFLIPLWVNFLVENIFFSKIVNTIPDSEDNAFSSESSSLLFQELAARALQPDPTRSQSPQLPFRAFAFQLLVCMVCIHSIVSPYGSNSLPKRTIWHDFYHNFLLRISVKIIILIVFLAESCFKASISHHFLQAWLFWLVIFSFSFHDCLFLKFSA